MTNDSLEIASLFVRLGANLSELTTALPSAQGDIISAGQQMQAIGGRLIGEFTEPLLETKGQSSMPKLLHSTVMTRNSSRSNPSVSYELRVNLDDEGHVYKSCNCPAWTRGADQKGKQAWERECRHTKASPNPMDYTDQGLCELLGLPSYYRFPWVKDKSIKRPQPKIAVMPGQQAKAEKPKPKPTRFRSIELD